MRILIAGCGRLGSSAATRLAAQGHTVYGLRRHWQRRPLALQPLQADLLDGASLAAIVPSDLDVILHVLTPDRRDQPGYRRAYLDTLQTLLDLPQLADPGQRWVFVSSTAVYGDAGADWVDESTPPAPADFNGRVLVEAEARLLAARPNAAVLRLGGIYGPGRDHLLRQARDGSLQVQRAPPHWSNRIHAEDAAEILARLALHSGCGVYNGVDAEPASEAEVADWLAQRLGLPAPPTRPASTERPNRRVAARRLVELDLQYRYPDFRVGYSALLSDAHDPPGELP